MSNGPWSSRSRTAKAGVTLGGQAWAMPAFGNAATLEAALRKNVLRFIGAIPADAQPPHFGIDKLPLVPQSGERKISKVNETIKCQSLLRGACFSSHGAGLLPPKPAREVSPSSAPEVGVRCFTPPLARMTG